MIAERDFEVVAASSPAVTFTRMHLHFVKALGVLLLAALAIGAASSVSGAAGGYTAPGGGGSAGSKPTLTLTVKKKQTTRSARSKGLKVAARCNVACKVTLRLLKGTTVVGSGSKNLPTHSGTVKVKLTKKAKKTLKRARKAKFRLFGGAQDAASRTSSPVVKTVRLKRR